MDNGLDQSRIKQGLEYLLEKKAPMVLHVATVRDNNFGFSVADTCCASASN